MNTVKPIYDESSDISNIDFRSSYFYENNILTEFFIEKYKDEVDWTYISFWQDLSEDFIIKYQDKVNWFEISCAQTLSNEFISKYIDKISIDAFKFSIKVDQNFVEKLNLLK